DHSFQRLLLSPAAGYRHRESGALTSVGGSGNYWSSSSFAAGNINAGYLLFSSGTVRPLDYTFRAYGLSVRCVQASTRRLFSFLSISENLFHNLKNSFFLLPGMAGVTAPASAVE
ncbi:MAG: fibrobacter succinogenes major paralogous domain-containing protein, partial [Alistipes sp.]|nr:fibrobacter succinogenes major paralogous domain-containing protein [Alistipes sp.]